MARWRRTGTIVALLNWNDSYSLGNAQIDADHRRLFDLINDFHYAFILNHDRSEIARMLNALVRYSQEHFEREEHMMAERGYPGLEKHQAEHVALFETVFDLQGKFERRELRMEKETVDFLRRWLVDHIADHDSKFAQFLVHG